MTLPASGTISINSLVGEYGGSAPHSMTEYYKGGGLVLNHSNNASVPTSGQIRLSDFYGQSNTQPFDASVTGTCGLTTESGKGFLHSRRGIDTLTSYLFVNHNKGSWSDASFTNPAGSTTFTIGNLETKEFTINAPGQKDVRVALAGNVGVGGSFSAATGWRYIKNGSTIIFDSNNAGNGALIPLSTTATEWFVDRTANSHQNHMPSSGSHTFTLSN